MRALYISAAVLIAGTLVLSAQGADWDSCADDLSSLRRAAGDASDAAEEASSAKDEFESKKDDLENCVNFPEVYDLMRDGCQSARWDYESARSDYESTLSNLESELDTVDSRLRSVSWSCGFQFSFTAPRSELPNPKSDRLCPSLSVAGSLPTRKRLMI